MKRQIVILTSLLFISGITLAQKGNLKKADMLFKMKAYIEAAEIYETNAHTQDVLQNLGDSYYYTANLQKAIKTYGELFVAYEKDIDLEFYFRYGQSLKVLKDYKAADFYLSKYYNKTINTSDFIALNTRITPHVFKLEQLINAKASESDFGLFFYDKNKVIYASARNSGHRLYGWNKLPYLDLYRATLSSSDELINVIPFSDLINTESHESNAVISADGKTMYFNRTNSYRTKTNKENIAHIKIFKAELIDGVWTNVKALPFNPKAYSAEHPALSEDGKTLYFASDMPGTMGGFDIFKVEIKDDGTYGEPENLGDKVNTIHREQFPYISNDVLYFASDGHENFGGLDVFRSNLVNGNFDTPINLGSSINSNYDDFAYSIRDEDNKGFVSSNRDGHDRLYRLDREDNILTKYAVQGRIQDKSDKVLLSESLVTLFDESGTVIQDSILGNTAAYLFQLKPNKTYKIKGTHKGYIPQEVTFSTDAEGKIHHNISLFLESYVQAEERVKENDQGDIQVQLDKIYFDFDTSKIRKDATLTLNVLVDLMKKYPSMEVEVSAHTDARGPDEYNLSLSKQRAASTLEYLVSQGVERSRLISEGYGEQKPLNKCIKEGLCKEEAYNVNRRCEFTILN